MGRPPDGCLVEIEPLALILRRFLDDWSRDRPPTGGRFASGGTIEVAGPIRGIDWLVSETHISAATIQNILFRRNRTTELRVADALLTALDRTDLFYDGSLTIVPNPFASAEDRAECCGGSTSSS